MTWKVGQRIYQVGAPGLDNDAPYIVESVDPETRKATVVFVSHWMPARLEVDVDDPMWTDKP